MNLTGNRFAKGFLSAVNPEYRRKEFAEDLLGKTSSRLKTRLGTKKILVAVAGGKGGVGKSTTTAETVGAVYWYVQPILKEHPVKIVCIDADIAGTNLGNRLNGFLEDMPENEVPYLNWFRVGMDGKNLSDYLYEVPGFPGLYLGAVPEINHVKNELSGYANTDSFKRLHKSIRELDADIVFVDLPPGGDRERVLDCWDSADVRVLSHKVELDAIMDAATLVENSQRFHVVNQATEMIGNHYRGNLEALEGRLRLTEERLEDSARNYSRASEEIGNIRDRIQRNEESLKEKQAQAKKLRQIVKDAREKESDGTISKALGNEIRTLSGDIRRLTSELKEYGLRNSGLKTDIIRYSGETTVYGGECQKFKQDIEELKAKWKAGLGEVEGLKSLREVIEFMRQLNQEKSTGLERRITFSESPIILVPNIVRAKESHSGVSVYKVINERLEEEGFLERNGLGGAIINCIHYVDDGNGKGEFFIPESGAIKQGLLEGMPLSLSNNPKLKYSTVANKYRILAYNILNHAFGGLENE